LKKALDEKGFDPNNENHWLIVCGDAFDRGAESEEVLHFLMSLERKILVKGNHDILLDALCDRQYPLSYDKSNGTVRTVQDLGGSQLPRDFADCCQKTLNKLARYRELLVNYFETKNYIFVHSWIPTSVHLEDNGRPWYQEIKIWMEDWRNANEVEWEEAMWVNPFKFADLNFNQTGKTIVFGHWHCSAGHKVLGNCTSEFENAVWEPCYYNNTIGIDRCTAHTGEVNVLVLEDDFLDS
jgi:serine/threonine protein phosphatase 1